MPELNFWQYQRKGIELTALSSRNIDLVHCDFPAEANWKDLSRLQKDLRATGLIRVHREGFVEKDLKRLGRMKISMKISTIDL